MGQLSKCKRGIANAVWPRLSSGARRSWEVFPFPVYDAAGKSFNYECEKHDGACPHDDECVFCSHAVMRVILISHLLCHHHPSSLLQVLRSDCLVCTCFQSSLKDSRVNVYVFPTDLRCFNVLSVFFFPFLIVSLLFSFVWVVAICFAWCISLWFTCSIIGIFSIFCYHQLSLRKASQDPWKRQNQR